MMDGMDPARRICQLDRRIERAEKQAAAAREERRAIRTQLRADGVGWAAIGAMSGVSPAAIQKDLQTEEQRAASNEAKRAYRRKPAPVSA